MQLTRHSWCVRLFTTGSPLGTFPLCWQHHHNIETTTQRQTWTCWCGFTLCSPLHQHSKWIDSDMTRLAKSHATSIQMKGPNTCLSLCHWAGTFHLSALSVPKTLHAKSLTFSQRCPFCFPRTLNPDYTFYSYLQHNSLLVMYMQAMRDPNYCAVLLKISFSE